MAEYSLMTEVTYVNPDGSMTSSGFKAHFDAALFIDFGDQGLIPSCFVWGW